MSRSRSLLSNILLLPVLLLGGVLGAQETPFIGVRVDADRNKLLLEVPAERIGRDFMHQVVLATGAGAPALGLDRGQLGDGTMTPVPVRGLGGVSAIAAGDAHTCALLQRGVVRCWGANGDGQLGDRTTTDRQRPVAVDRLASVGAISTGAGVNHTCALLVRGELRCWGDNDYGQLGDGTITDRRSPVLVRWIR